MATNLTELIVSMKYLKDTLDKKVVPKIDEMHDKVLNTCVETEILNKEMFGTFNNPGVLKRLKSVEVILAEYNTVIRFIKWLITVLAISNVSILAYIIRTVFMGG